MYTITPIAPLRHDISLSICIPERLMELSNSKRPQDHRLDRGRSEALKAHSVALDIARTLCHNAAVTSMIERMVWLLLLLRA